MSLCRKSISIIFIPSITDEQNKVMVEDDKSSLKKTDSQKLRKRKDKLHIISVRDNASCIHSTYAKNSILYFQTLTQ